AGREQRNYVRVLQAGGDADLALEPCDAYHRPELGREHLEHDGPSEGDLLGHEHAAHAAAAQLPVDAVGGAEMIAKFVQEHRPRYRATGPSTRRCIALVRRWLTLHYATCSIDPRASTGADSRP